MEEDNVLNVVKIFPVVSRYRMLLNVCEDKKKRHANPTNNIL